MPKLSPEKLNPAHDAIVRRMLAASPQANGATGRKLESAPAKDIRPPARPASAPAAK